MAGVSNGRYQYIDMSRGINVLFFIIIHVYQLIYAASPYDSVVYRALFFVTGFFAFSSGYVAGLHYYSIAIENGKKCSLRIFTRALKLFAIVMASNIAKSILTDKGHGFLVPVHQVFSLLYFDRWDVAHQMLASIGCSLILISCIFILHQRFWEHAAWALIALLLLIAIFHGNSLPYMWRFALGGLIGFILGIRQATNRSLPRAEYFRYAFFVAASAMLCIAAYKKYFFFSLLANPFLVFLSATICSLAFYDISDWFLNRFTERFWAVDVVNLIGRMSLFVYVTQGFVIMILSKVITKYMDWPVLLISFFVFIFMVAITVATNRLLKFSVVRVPYKIIFQ